MCFKDSMCTSNDFNYYYLKSLSPDDVPPKARSLSPPPIVGYLGITPMFKLAPNSFFYQNPSIPKVLGVNLGDKG